MQIYYKIIPYGLIFTDLAIGQLDTLDLSPLFTLDELKIDGRCKHISILTKVHKMWHTYVLQYML